jgi:hypothetical protein
MKFNKLCIYIKLKKLERLVKKKMKQEGNSRAAKMKKTGYST